MYRVLRNLPFRTIGMIVVGWVFLAALNFQLDRMGIRTGVPFWFPISVFRGPTVHLSGVAYLCAFVAVLALAVKLSPRLHVHHVWLLGLLLIVFGNLGQGGWETAFRAPLNEKGQYYADAVTIQSWQEWLRSFNTIQPTLSTHAKTHPPFAVLIHYFLLRAARNNLDLLSAAFVLIASLSLPLIWNIFRRAGVPLARRNLLTVLAAVLPAVNIYSAVSLDALVVTGATLFLFGIVSIVETGRISASALVSAVVGFSVMNLLNYAGIFLLGVAGVLVVREFMLWRRYTVAISLAVSVAVFAVIVLMLYSRYGYNHVTGFFEASTLEKPDLLREWHDPIIYLGTRIEDVCEIGLFLSLGFLAVLFHPGRLRISYVDWRDSEVAVFISGVVTLLVVFSTGAFHTGETARAALFIYPYIMLTLEHADVELLTDLVAFAGLQTVVMQLFGGYFW